VKGKLEISEDAKRTLMFSEINYLLEHQILSILKNRLRSVFVRPKKKKKLRNALRQSVLIIFWVKYIYPLELPLFLQYPPNVFNFCNIYPQPCISLPNSVYEEYFVILNRERETLQL
jgi:hypothetical protein